MEEREEDRKGERKRERGREKNESVCVCVRQREVERIEK